MKQALTALGPRRAVVREQLIALGGAGAALGELRVRGGPWGRRTRNTTVAEAVSAAVTAHRRIDATVGRSGTGAAADERDDQTEHGMAMHDSPCVGGGPACSGERSSEVHESRLRSMPHG